MVGIVSDTPSVPQDHGVDRADGARLVRKSMQVRDDGLLAGVRDVQAGKAEAFGSDKQLAQVGRRQAELVEVDALVEAENAVVGRLVLVKGGAQRFTDALADQSEQQGRGFRIGAHVGSKNMY